MAGISKKDMVINNIVAAMGEHLDSKLLRLLENVMRQNLYGLEVTEECTDLAVRMEDNDRIVQVFLASKKLEGCKDNSLLQYRLTAQQFFSVIQKKYTDVTKDDIKVYLAWRMQRVKPKTVQNTKSNLSSLFGWLHDEGYISANPVSRGRIKLDELENIHLTPEEEVQVRDVPKNLKEAAIVDFLLSTGVRVGELASMNISDVDFAKGTVTFRGEKGSCRFRTVLLDVRAKRHLMDYLNERTDTNPALFVTDRRYNGAPKRMSKHGLETITKTVGKRAGLDKNLTVHVFRRTFATRLADAGCPLEVIQELMGHVKPETTQRYIAKSQARVVQSAARYFNAA